MEHTTGKWKYDPFTGEIKSRLLGENGFVKVCDMTEQDTPFRMFANAQLIASAPDMYEALNHIQLYFALADQIAHMPNHSAVDTVIEKALAKAEGK